MQPDNLGPLAASLAKAQAGFPAIPRDKEVIVQKKTGGTYTFKYAPLDAILTAVRTPLSANGLAISQLLDGGDLVTLLLHEGGGSLEGRVPLPSNPGDNIQQLGSAITYLRRYALQAILGIASEEDDDGNAAADNHAMPTARAPRRVDTGKAEILPPRQINAPRPVAAPPSVSDADVANLHAQFGDAFVDLPDDLERSTGLTSAELFQAAEDAGITTARLTVSAKTMFGANRWKLTDLTDEERAQLWAETAGVPA